MVVPGQMNVSPTGAFTYTIPIVVPPGTAGMVPSLSLDYSSQNGDGLEGLGWTLSGLPSIGRCPRTIAQDSVHGGVNYDANDRFCMEGQRLVAISGTYGANGTEYRTEIESFSKVISYGAAGTGPAYFKVWTKSGQIIEFGNTTDSRIEAVGKTTARAWAVNKISDTKGNYLTVTYTDDQTNGQAYPTRIDYTGNASASLSPYNSVQFTYTTRGDITPTYHAGSLMQTTKMLTNIKTYQATNLVSDYRLAYQAGTSTTHSRLTSVTLCNGAGTPACLPATTFTWQGEGTLSLTQSSPPNFPTIAAGLFAADFNGDGLTDIATMQQPVLNYLGLPTNAPCPNTGFYSFYLSNSSGGFSGWNPTLKTIDDSSGATTSAPYCLNYPPYGEQSSFNAYDFDGDGRADIGTNLSQIYVAASFVSLQTTSGFVKHSSGASSTTSSTHLDYNGDGRTDLIFADQQYTLYQMDASGTFSGTTIPTSGGLGYADFDGDGCPDTWSQLYPQTLVIYYRCNPAVSSYSNSAIKPFADSGPRVPVLTADFNGDGNDDFIDVTGKLFLSTGTAMVDTGWVWPSTWTAGHTIVGDWNRDGKADLLLSTTVDPDHYTFFISTGSGFEQVTGASLPLGVYFASNGKAGSTPIDWDGDGTPDFWVQDGTTDALFSFENPPELLTAVSNGIGATTYVSYDRLNKNGTFYTKGTGSTYPTQDMDGPIYAVKEIDSSNGIGTCTPPTTTTGCYTTTYAYAGAKRDLSGRGFLGFSQVTITDPQTNIVQSTTYRTDYPFTGMTAVQTKTHAGITLSSTTNTFSSTSLGGTRYFTYITQSTSAANDLDGTTLPTTTTTYSYDSYGNALTVAANVSDGSSKATTNTYYNDSANWILGRLLTVQTQSIVGSSNITRQSSFCYELSTAQGSGCSAYGSSTGLLVRETVEPNNSSLKLVTDYTYDSFGNKLTAQVSGTGITTRTTSTSYDTKGRFATNVTNALSQSETWAFDEKFGLATSHTGPNGLTTTWTYDTFGRKTLEVRPDGNRMALVPVNYGPICSTCVPNAQLLMAVRPYASDGVTTNGVRINQFYDSLGRSLVDIYDAFQSGSYYVTTEYDAYGRVYRKSRPYSQVSGQPYPFGTPKWTTYTYDDLGRITDSTLPDSSHVAACYAGLVTSTTNDKNQTKTTWKNAQGLVWKVKEGTGVVSSGTYKCDPATVLTTITYTYDAFGNLLTVTDPVGNVTTNTYDTRGRKTDSYDPDMGHWTYAYNVLDQLTSQTDAKSQSTSLSYDLLGRLTQQVQGGVTTTWTFGTSAANHNIGQLVSTTTGAGYTRSHTYDSYGRPSGTALAVDGTAYNYAAAYNSNGQVDTVTYPSAFVAKYTYNTYGYLTQIKDNASGSALWTPNARDAEMHLTQSTLGNGVVENATFDANTGLVQQITAGPSQSVANFSYGFDTIGNLTSRADTYQGYTEAFCYDDLNRLTDSAMVSGGTTCATGTNHKVVTYNAIGNIASKTGIGTYAYPASGASSVQPHAVSDVSGTVNGHSHPYYRYDPNGNLTCMSSSSAATYNSCTSAIRTVTYTAFNMVAQIVEGSNTYAFSYDSEHARIKQVAPQLTTLYLNAMGAMSEKLVGASSTTWRDYIMADGHMVAQRDKVVSSGTVTWSYFVADHLGSIAVITDASGAVTERLSYDAWGKRRNANGTDANCGTISSSATRGFTGHEMLDGLCLVNMNARIYDPDIGRFMVADTHVTDSTNVQDWNSFTYVNNRPLSADDPTGHDIGGGNDPGYHWDPYQWNLDLFGTCYGNCGSEGATDVQGRIINHSLGKLQKLGFSPSRLTIQRNENGSLTVTVRGEFKSSGATSEHPIAQSETSQTAAAIDASHNSGGEKFSFSGSFAILYTQQTGISSKSNATKGGIAPISPDNIAPLSLSSKDFKFTAGRFIYATDQYGTIAETLKPDELGRYIVAGHGAVGGGVSIYKNQLFDAGISAQRAAYLIRSSGTYMGEDILLLMCFGGSKPSVGQLSFAQALANELHVSVYATDTWVQVSNLGYTSAPLSDSNLASQKPTFSDRKAMSHPFVPYLPTSH